MATMMTRAEYEQKYGVKPVIQSSSVLDQETPAPRRMTRAEYEAEFFPTTTEETGGGIFSGLKRAITDLKTTYGGGEQGIANRLKQNVVDASQDIQKGKMSDFFGFNTGLNQTGISGDTGKGVQKAAFRTAGDVANTIWQPIGAAMQVVGLDRLFEKIGEFAVKGKYNPLSVLTDTKAAQEFVTQHPNLEEDFNRAIGLGFAGLEGGSPIRPRTMIPRTVEQLRTIGPKVKETIAPIRTKMEQRAIDKVTAEIGRLEDNYAKLRTYNEYLTDSGAASRRRIAESKVLEGSADADGTIRTTTPGGAVDIYKNMTLKGREGVVRENLVKNAETVNIKQVENYLKSAIMDSKLAGADLVAALNAIKREMKGLAIKADEFGNILLQNIHDAKINMTDNINFQTPPETQTYRKTVAKAYKELVEAKSTKFDVKPVNRELSKYYKDVEKLKMLDGRKVKGGKLGKYSAQISGNIIGGAAGSVGGPVGAALGTIVGGETAGFIKGRQLQSAFTRTRGVRPREIKNPILEQARASARGDAILDLRVADRPVGAPKGIPKTKEVVKLESQIKKNVKEQKAAIKKGDFSLVAALKDIYNALVQLLKDEIAKIKSIGNKEGGFVRVGQSNKRGNLNKQYKKTNTKNNAVIELKNSIKTKRDIPFRNAAGEKFTVKSGEVIKFGDAKGSNKIIQIGDKRYTVNKNQFDNLKNNSLVSEAKEFAPELAKTEEVIKGGDKTFDSVAMELFNKPMSELTGPQRVSVREKVSRSTADTKYSQYTLPDGKNYREILIKAPDTRKAVGEGAFKSSHWDEPNVISHLRMNDRTYKGKKVSFMEELQSDWARELRKKGSAFEGNPRDFLPEGARVTTNGDSFQVVDRFGNRMPNLLGEGMAYGGSEKVAIGKAIGEARLLGDYSGVPNNPLLKNWQEMTVKRALKDAVDSGAEYFSWINGEQTSARYNLATYLDEVSWGTGKTKSGETRKLITLSPREGTLDGITINDKGVIVKSARDSWKGKKLDEVLGKGLADKIMAKSRGELSGEGLKFGGEWANNLYDKQVPNIVKDLTGAKIEKLDLGLPIGSKHKNQSTQLGIKLTPDVKAIVKGEKPPMNAGKIGKNLLIGTALLSAPLIFDELFKVK